MFVFKIPYFDLEQTYNSGQDLRWKKLDENLFLIPDGQKVNLIKQKRDMFSMSCSENEFFTHWYNYFDLGTDYESINFKLTKVCNKEFKVAANRSQGVRLMNRDCIETIISPLLRQQNCYSLKAFINDVGDLHKSSSKSNWCSLPEINDILTNKRKLNVINEVLDEDIKDKLLSVLDLINDEWINLGELLLGDFEDVYTKNELAYLKSYLFKDTNEIYRNKEFAQAIKFYLETDSPKIYEDWYKDDVGKYNLYLQHYLLNHFNNKPKSLENL